MNISEFLCILKKTLTAIYPDTNQHSSIHLVVALALCLGIQAITTDLYLPSLPLITENLGTQVSKTQLTLSMLLVFFGLGQLIAGPLSDKFGRRPVLIASLIFYSVSAMAASASDAISTLIIWRSLQGFFYVRCCCLCKGFA